MRFLVTGANGFVGRSCFEALGQRTGDSVVGTVRSAPRVSGHVQVGDLGPNTSWRQALEGVDTVIHTAARVHMDDRAATADAAHLTSNLDGTLNLGRQAADAGVKRLVFISTIGVNGQKTRPGVPFVGTDSPGAEGPYARAKLLAERGLAALSAETDLEVVIIRPPLVYGHNAPGNFATMLKWARSGLPLPLGGLNNRRSMISVENLTDLIVAAATHPGAAGQILLASDGEDLSTDEWLRRIAKALGRPSRLIPVPSGLLRGGAMLLGKPDIARRLLDSLQVDIEPTRRVMNWTPPLTVDQSLALAVRQ